MTPLIWTVVVMATFGSLPTTRSVTPWDPTLPWKPTMSNYHHHPCARECVEGAVPLVCEYDFVIEYYYTLTRACYGCPYNQSDCARPHCVPADGRSRGILTVNRMIPGPGLHVCVGDFIKVNVKNKLEGSEGTTIHWHGVHQNGSPHMDGVPMLTQCPIHAHSTFQYNFRADLPGTHYWHAHAGLQRADGLFGALVIRQPRARDVHAGLYDFDLAHHTVLINDWLSEMSATRFSGHHHAMADHSPDSILINGQGTKHVFSDSPPNNDHSHGHGDNSNDQTSATNGHDGHDAHSARSATSEHQHQPPHEQPAVSSSGSIMSGHSGMMTHSDSAHDQNIMHLSHGPSPATMVTESPMSNGDHRPMPMHNTNGDMGQPIGTRVATTESQSQNMHRDGHMSSDGVREGHQRSKRGTDMLGCNHDNGHKHDKVVRTPHAVFHVLHGFRYRFRLISNGVNNCPIHFSVDNHTLFVISSDGSPFRPLEVESLNLFTGERYDVILVASNPVGNYWIRTRGLADCGPDMKSASQTAILRYKGADDTFPPGCTDYESGDRKGRKLNPYNSGRSGKLVTVDELEALTPNDISLKTFPDKRFYLAMDFNMVENYRFHDPEYYPLSSQMGAAGGHHAHHLFTPQINRITFMSPPSPALSQYHRASQYFCDEKDFQVDCKSQLCECTHRLKVRVGEVVELVMIDEGKHLDNSHPMHLHGHSFRVVAMEKLNTSTSVEYVKMLDRMGHIYRKLDKAITKDTVSVPDGGYTIVRFHAKNPGFWLLHCHIAFHMEMGMSLVIQVGEVSEMPTPPKNFPRCGDWTSQTQDSDDFPACGPSTSAFPLVMGTDVSSTFYDSTAQPHYISNFNPPQPPPTPKPRPQPQPQPQQPQGKDNTAAENRRLQMLIWLTRARDAPTPSHQGREVIGRTSPAPHLPSRSTNHLQVRPTDHSDRVLSMNPLLYQTGDR